MIAYNTCMHVVYLKSPFPKLPSNSICANFYLYSTAIIFKPFEFNMHPSHLLSITVCVNCNVVIMQRIIALLCYVHKTGRRRVVLTDSGGGAWWLCCDIGTSIIKTGNHISIQKITYPFIFLLLLDYSKKTMHVCKFGFERG